MDRYKFEDCISDYLENKIPLSKRKEFEKYLKLHPEGLELMNSVQEVMDSMKSISETKVSPDFMNNLHWIHKIREVLEKNGLLCHSSTDCSHTLSSSHIKNNIFRYVFEPEN